MRSQLIFRISLCSLTSNARNKEERQKRKLERKKEKLERKRERDKLVKVGEATKILRTKKGSQINRNLRQRSTPFSFSGPT